MIYIIPVFLTTMFIIFVYCLLILNQYFRDKKEYQKWLYYDIYYKIKQDSKMIAYNIMKYDIREKPIFINYFKL